MARHPLGSDRVVGGTTAKPKPEIENCMHESEMNAPTRVHATNYQVSYPETGYVIGDVDRMDVVAPGL